MSGERCLEGDLVVDGVGGAAGWLKRKDEVLAQIRAAAPDTRIDLENMKLSVYVAADALDTAQAQIEGVLGANRVSVAFRLWTRESESGQWTVANGGARLSAAPVMIVTTNDAPGYEILELCGEVFGITVRTRNIFSRWGADMKSLVGGELGGMTKLLATSRDEAVERLRQEARGKGANAILAFRFDSSEIGEHWNEICAYGTAAKVRRTHPAGSGRPAEPA